MTRQASYIQAIEAEIRSQQLYQALTKSFGTSDTARVFKQLLTLEQNHEAKLRNAFAREFPHSELVLNVPLPVLKPGINLSDPKEVLEYAITREESAHDGYLALAAHAADLEIKSTLLRFAAEEIDHKALLIAEVQRIQGVLTWYDPSELNGLMED